MPRPIIVETVKPADIVGGDGHHEIRAGVAVVHGFHAFKTAGVVRWDRLHEVGAGIANNGGAGSQAGIQPSPFVPPMLPIWNAFVVTERRLAGVGFHLLLPPVALLAVGGFTDYRARVEGTVVIRVP